MAKFVFTYTADNGHSETHKADAANQAEVVRMLYMILARAVSNEGLARSDRAKKLKDTPMMEESDIAIQMKVNDCIDKLGGWPTPTPQEKRRLEERTFKLQAELYRREVKKRNDDNRRRVEEQQQRREAEERQHEAFQ